MIIVFNDALQTMLIYLYILIFQAFIYICVLFFCFCTPSRAQNDEKYI